MSLLIKNGRVVDPKNNIDTKLDIYIKNGKIAEIGKKLTPKTKETIDAT